MTEENTQPAAKIDLPAVGEHSHTHSHTHEDACGCGHDHDHDHGDHHGHHHLAPVETYTRGAPKVGRNDACPCGSGKKYKKCCLAA